MITQVGVVSQPAVDEGATYDFGPADLQMAPRTYALCWKSVKAKGPQCAAPLGRGCQTALDKKISL